MICLVIRGPSWREVETQMLQASRLADVLELRLDLFAEQDFKRIALLQKRFPIPIILTLRSKAEGGEGTDGGAWQSAKLLQLAALRPQYLDVEMDVPAAVVAEINAKYPEIKIIISSHNFTNTPRDLNALYLAMQKEQVWAYKIAVTAQNSIDCLRLLLFAKQTSGNIIAISMGPFGEISRILAPVIGSPLTYACLDDELQTAPGQISAKTLLERYHYRALRPSTAIYGLIGNPVAKSISDTTHNALLQAQNLKAVYVKIVVQEHELEEFLELARQLPFQGFSVTMPLKTCIVALLARVTPESAHIGAINTLKQQPEGWIGTNTDGIGALNAIERICSVKDKEIALLGAGGSARAIACESLLRGGKLTIINRHPHKAKELAATVNGQMLPWDAICTLSMRGIDILINTTPLDMPIDEKDMLHNSVVMDVKTRPKQSTFLKTATLYGNEIVYGYQMFVEQAIGQFEWWFKEDFNSQAGWQLLEKEALTLI